MQSKALSTGGLGSGSQQPQASAPGGPSSVPMPASSLAASSLPMPALRDARVAPRRRSRSRDSRGGGRSGGGGGRRAVPSGLSPRDLLFVLFKFKRRALCTAAAVLILATLATLLLPSKYRSEAELKVNPGRETIGLDPTAGLGQSQLITTDFNRQVETEAALLRSRAVAEKTVELLKLGFFNVAEPADPERHARAVAAVAGVLEGKVDVTAIKNTQNLAVAYETKNPADAQKVVKAWVEAYLSVRSETRAGGQTARALAKQSDDARERLNKIEAQILALKASTGVSEPEAQKTILLSRIQNLQTEIDRANAERSGAMNTVRTLEEQLSITPREIRLESSTGAPMGTLDAAQSELARLRRQEAEALTKFLPGSTPVTLLREQIAAQERQVEALRKGEGEVRTGQNPTYVAIEGQLKTAIALRDSFDGKLTTLVADREKAQSGIATLDQVSYQMKQLALEANVTEDSLKRLRQGLDSARTDESMSGDKDASDVAIYQPPTYNERPVGPNRMVMLVGGIFAAFACGTGAALVSELVDQRVSRPLDLFKVGFEKVVSIPVLTMTRSLDGNGVPEDESPLIARDDGEGTIDLTAHETPRAGVNVGPQSIDLNRPTRFVRSAPRPGVSILPQRPVTDDALSAREVLERLAPQHVQQPVAPTLRLTSEASADAPTQAAVQVTTPVGRPALSPRFLDAANAILERLVFTPVSTGQMPMPRTLAVVSATPGQGTSTVAAHLAAALSDHMPNGITDPANKVLLVDANLVAPSVHRIMDVAPAPGVAEWVLDPQFAEQPTESISRRTALPKLDVLTSGVVTNGHQPGRWADAVLAAAHSKYHAVIVDLPAMSRCDAAARVAGLCDAAIVVVECDGGNREVLREAVARLNESGVHVLGVVLNKRTFPIPETLYRKM